MRKSNFYSWKHDSTTKFVMSQIKRIREDAEKLILSGKLLNSPDFNTQYAKQVGFIEGLNRILNIENDLELTQED